MDPNANLHEQRQLVQKMIRDYDDPDGNGIDQEDANRLAELSEALDQWMSRGGFLPEEWTKGR